MLDINFIREHKSDVEHAIREKRYNVSLDELLKTDDERRELLKKVEALRKEKNEIADKMKKNKGKPEQSLIERGKEIKAELSSLEKSLSKKETKLKTSLKSVPNIIFDDVPLGGEEDSVEIKTWGEKKKSGVDHLDYAISRDWVDFDRGAKVAGSKFYYLKNELALLENALLQYGLKKVLEHGFTYMTVPDLVSSEILEGCGFNPRTSDQSDEYFVENEDLALIATAEMPLTGYHMNEILDENKLPLL
ncbi:serine--tRNA ligase, partial [Candidatus Saccharibacteria bacterium]|nr:serine--tRNA ligase [Candidatus Saccharibacteria bacterium]